MRSILVISGLGGGGIIEPVSISSLIGELTSLGTIIMSTLAGKRVE